SVRSRTEGKQTPWESSSLEGDFYFSSTTNSTNAAKSNLPPAFDPATIELSFWESIKNTNDVEDYKEYLAKYPTGTFAGLARNKIRSLEATSKPAVNPSGSDSALKQRPYDKDRLIMVLQLNALSTAEIVKAIQQRGVDFRMTSDIESQFRSA